jgi:hypothetical protein
LKLQRCGVPGGTSLQALIDHLRVMKEPAPFLQKDGPMSTPSESAQPPPNPANEVPVSELVGAPTSGDAHWKIACAAAVVSLTMAVAGSVWALVSVRDGARPAASELVRAPPAAESADGTTSQPIILPPLRLLPPSPPPPITLVLNADLGTQRLTVSEHGKIRFTWPISSGKSGFDTKTGTFTPQWASRLWYSRQYDNAPMPHAVFFHRGMAFHATTAVGMLGRPASHGCIRLAPGNAAHLYKLVHKHGFAQTRIVVHNGSRGAKSIAGKKPKPRGEREMPPAASRVRRMG